MLFPPDNFQPTSPQLYLWQLGIAPALCVLVLYGGQTALLVFLALSIPGLLIGFAMAWLSVYGSRHAIFAALLGWSFFYLPLAMALPLLLENGEYGSAIYAAGIQVIVLLASTSWFWFHLPLPKPEEKLIEWPSIKIDLTKRLIRRNQGSSTIKQGGIAAALVSVPLYHTLSPYLATASGILILAFTLSLLFASLTVITIARPLAQGLRLRTIERETGLFVTENFKQLELQRQSYSIGRWLRRSFPLE